eukprot:gene5721-6616_t
MSSDDFLGEVFIDLENIPEDPTWYALQPRTAHPDDFVKGDVLIKARIVTSSGVQRDRIPGNLLTEVNNRVTAFEENKELLDLSGIGLEQLPEFLPEHVPTLVNLDLGFNQFKMFPTLRPFALMQSLSLSGNIIMTIPGELLDLPALRTLTINGNQLIALPPEIGKLINLEKLEVANNKIASLCDEIGKLTKLEELVIAGNPLTSLPPSFANLNSLEVLDANGCHLVRLPDEFPLMTRLLELNLGNNKLVDLPNHIGRMTRLVVLNIMDNRLNDLPLSIGYCFGLGKLGAGINIEGNPIQSEEIKMKYKIGNDHLMDYLEKRMTVQGYSLPELTSKTTSTNNLKGLATGNAANTSAGNLKTIYPMSGIPGPGAKAQPPAQQQPVQPVPLQLVSPNKPATQTAAGGVNVTAQQDVLTKTIALKNWAVATIRGELRPKVNKIKTQIIRCVNIQEGISIANMIKMMKSEIEIIKTLIPKNFPTPGVPMSGSGKIHSGNEKLEQLKDLVVASIDDIDIVLDTLYQLIPNTSDPQLVVGLVQSLKKIKEFLP